MAATKATVKQKVILAFVLITLLWLPKAACGEKVCD